MFTDLRGFLRELEELDQLKRVDGADWNLEIGTIVELMAERKGPALMFGAIKGYPKEYRIASNFLRTPLMLKIALGLDRKLSDMDAVKAFKTQWNDYRPVPPEQVQHGPVKENVLTGDRVDLLRFPTPKWHEQDGGRYIGTGCLVITRCRDTGWVNIGTYRVMVHDHDTLSFYVNGGHHGDIMRQAYWAKGEDCPVVMCFGQDPLLFCLGSTPVPWGVSEFDFAGHLKGRPIQVLKGDITGLPIPASAEIVIEGFAPPPSVEARKEGPFGEWTGYYASGSRVEPIVKVQAIYHRDEPIMHGQPTLKPTIAPHFAIPFHSTNSIWSALERARIPGVKGVWVHGPGNQPIPVVSIEQKYHGHAKQIATFVAASYQGNACDGRIIIVVDDDIDPSDLEEVLWAVSTRCDPETAVETVHGYRTSLLDPILSPEKRASDDITTAKILIDACRPYRWRDKFPAVCAASGEQKQAALEKWRELFQ